VVPPVSTVLRSRVSRDRGDEGLEHLLQQWGLRGGIGQLLLGRAEKLQGHLGGVPGGPAQNIQLDLVVNDGAAGRGVPALGALVRKCPYGALDRGRDAGDHDGGHPILGAGMVVDADDNLAALGVAQLVEHLFMALSQHLAHQPQAGQLGRHRCVEGAQGLVDALRFMA
jgi:hypothetical protein